VIGGPRQPEMRGDQLPPGWRSASRSRSHSGRSSPASRSTGSGIRASSRWPLSPRRGFIPAARGLGQRCRPRPERFLRPGRSGGFDHLRIPRACATPSIGQRAPFAMGWTCPCPQTALIRRAPGISRRRDRQPHGHVRARYIRGPAGDAGAHPAACAPGGHLHRPPSPIAGSANVLFPFVPSMPRPHSACRSRSLGGPGCAQPGLMSVALQASPPGRQGEPRGRAHHDAERQPDGLPLASGRSPPPWPDACFSAATPLFLLSVRMVSAPARPLATPK